MSLKRSLKRQEPRNRGVQLVPADSQLRILMITSEWPTPASPNDVPFIVQQVKFLRRLGVYVDVFHFRGSGNPVQYLRAWCGARARLSRRRYDLVHAQWGQSALLALPKKIPLVTTFRGSDLEGVVSETGRYTVSGRILKIISKLMARASDQVIVVSESLASHLPNLHCHVVPSGVDLTLFRPIPQEEARRRLGLPMEKLLVCFAASPNRAVKRYSLAREAVTLLAPRFDVDLIVTSGVPRSLMPYYFSACDALLLTSSHEGSPNVLKEALACDLPVVSVDVGDARQRLSSVDGCFVCADARPETLAKSLSQVLEARRRIQGVAAVRDLSEGELASRVLAVYRSAARLTHPGAVCRVEGTRPGKVG